MPAPVGTPSRSPRPIDTIALNGHGLPAIIGGADWFSVSQTRSLNRLKAEQEIKPSATSKERIKNSGE